MRMGPRIIQMRNINWVGIAICLWVHLGTQSVLASSQYALGNAVYTHEAPQINVINVLSKSKLPLKNEVAKLYELQGFELIWSDGTQYNDNARQLVEIIQQARRYGLNALDYDLEFIQYFLDATSVDPMLLSRSDVAFTHAYIKLASHINNGVSHSSPASEREQQLLTTLSYAVDQNTISAAIDQLQPSNSNYVNLVRALGQYRALELSEEPIQLKTHPLAMGDRSADVVVLRKKLHHLGDYTGIDLESDLFDEDLAVAVSNFQRRHGLEADAILGRQTMRELNTPIAHRIMQLEINLERARTLSGLNNDRYLLINIPAYQLYLYENNQVAYQSRVIVGKKKHKTPQLSSHLTKVILSPYWNVPRSIARNEIIPELQKDPQYLAKNNMKLFGRLNNQVYQVNPDAINWSAVDPASSTFRIRQEPGAENSLGQIKFIFPNRHSVYLHDTPARNLFAQPRRAFSHGCVRLEDPFGLAEVLLSSGDGAYSRGDLEYLAKKSKSRTVKLTQPVPIHITYMTAWADEHGVVHFRPDIYQRDSQFAASLYNAKN